MAVLGLRKKNNLFAGLIHIKYRQKHFKTFILLAEILVIE